METLRRILSQLVKDKGHFVEIQENQSPLLHLAKTTQTLETFPPLSASWIGERVAEILPREASAYEAGKLVEGRLVIKTVGSLHVLAYHNPLPCLVFFMPNFDIELEKYKRNLPQLDMEITPRPPVPGKAPVKATPPMGDLFASLTTIEPTRSVPVQAERIHIPVRPMIEVKIPPTAPAEEAKPIFPQPEIRFTPPAVTPVAAPVPEPIAYMPPPVAAPEPIAYTPPPVAASGDRSPIDYAPVLASVMSWSKGDYPIDVYLKELVGQKGSDLHLTTGQPVAFRKDGDIQKKVGVIITPALIASLLDPIIPALQRSKFTETWDVDFAYEIEGFGRFRVNLFREQGGVGAVLRHIPQTILTAAELGLPDSILKFGKLNKGLVLITGPTGSGKTTTLAALIESINEARPLHIVTIEDPIEFSYHSKKALIRQREVGKHTNSFATALRAALREDPDIVLIGELRDAETTAIAIETAETGHLVFATLHTNSAVSTVNRIIDQFPSEKQPLIRSMLASSLKGVVTQTLVKKIGGGRCAAAELLIPDDAVASMIREGKTHMIENHMQTQKANGNQLLNEALLQLVTKGAISSREAWENAIDRKSLEEMAKRKNITFM